MLYSEKRKFVFVAVPKTGTTSIEKRLKEVDQDLMHNAVLNAAGDRVPLSTHATALEIRKAMESRAECVTFVAFLRDPRDIVVSKYYFYRTGRAARKQGLAKARTGEIKKFSLGRTLRVLFAKALPLNLWARLYPYSSCSDFITNKDGVLIVDRIGMMETLQEDMLRIFGEFGYSPEELELGVTNRTEYDRERTRNLRLENIVERRLPTDCALFDQVLTERTAQR